MVHISKLKTILSMEASRFFHNRKQVITTFLLGPVIVFLMLYGVNAMATTQPRIEIRGAAAYQEALTGLDEAVVFADSTADPQACVSAGENIVLIAVGQNSVEIFYDSSLLTSSSLLYRAQELADRISALQISELQYPVFDEALRGIQVVDLSSPADRIETVLIPIAGLIFVVGLMLANTGISSLATDTIAGERERGTFDMLRLSGTNIPTIILGKFLFIVLIGTAVLVLEAAALALGLQESDPELFLDAAALAAQNPLWFLPVLLCLLNIAVLTTALYLALSASFEKVKQVGAYASIAQIVLSLFTHAPNVVDAQTLNYLPISNLWIVLQKALIGESALIYAASSTLISLVIAVAALCYGTIILEKETKK